MRAVIDKVVRLCVVVRSRFSEINREFDAAEVAELSACDVQADDRFVEYLVQAWIHVGLMVFVQRQNAKSERRV